MKLLWSIAGCLNVPDVEVSPARESREAAEQPLTPLSATFDAAQNLVSQPRNLSCRLRFFVRGAVLLAVFVDEVYAPEWWYRATLNVDSAQFGI
jgi:hypothetical protein